MRLLPLAVSLFACSPSLEDASFPTGSSTAAMSRDGSHLLVLDEDSGSVVRTDVDSGSVVDSLALGGEPSRIAPIGDSGRFAVTLRAARTLAVVDTAGGLSLEATVEIGTEPVAVVSTEDGARLYVAASAQNQVIELDGTTLAELRRFDVPGEPRWLALRPGGGALYVMSAFGGEGSFIDLGDGEVAPIEMPDVGPYSVRLTGDPAVSADGNWLVVPALYVDNFTEERADSLGTSLYYAMPGKWNPVLVSFTLGGGGRPGDHPLVSYVTAQGTTGAIGSYASAVVLDPSLPLAWVALEGADAVVASNYVGKSRYGGYQGIRRTSVVVRQTGAGPRGFAFHGDRGFVHAALDHAVQPIDVAQVRQDLADRISDADGGRYEDPSETLSEPVVIASRTLDRLVEEGRRAFYSTNDPSVVLPGSGVSCATCHFEGRNDGLTWPLAPGLRQTPSLAGKVSDTAPVTWTEGVMSVAHEVELTSANRMGGDGQALNSEAIAAYIDFSRHVDLPLHGASDPAIARGKAVFEREDTACASCHSGAAFTDGQNHRVFGIAAIDTPTLRGIAATAPYLHDGRFETLGALLDDLDGEMGDTSLLTATERADLETYLKSL